MEQLSAAEIHIPQANTASKYQCVKKIPARKPRPSGLKYGNPDALYQNFQE